MQTDQETRVRLDKVLANLCKNRKRHDAIITHSVQDAVRLRAQDPIGEFAKHIGRRLQKNESVVINDLVIKALFETSHDFVPDHGLQILQKKLRDLPFPFTAEAQPILNQTTRQPILLIVSRHAFRVLEIASDISDILSPESSPELKKQRAYLANIAHVSENLSQMGKNYSLQDILDCLYLIKDSGAFYLRAGFVFKANLEPQLFTEKLEEKGFSVSILLDEDETDEEFKEHDFLKRLQGYLITKSSDAMQEAVQHVDFLQDLTRNLPLPDVDLARPINLG